MKITPIYLLLSFTLSAGVSQANDNSKPVPGVNFTENKGQFADQNYNPRPDVLFGGSDGEIAFHITNKGISYQLYRVDRFNEIEDPKTKEKRKEIAQQTIYRTDIKWMNANPNPLVFPDEPLPGFNNYYLEQCPNGALEVKSYKGITLQNIYNNIDLHYYENGGKLKCDYIVAPHADYSQIQLKVEGAILKLQSDGSLLIETPLGSIVEQAPIVYQNGKRLEANYLINNNQISFEVKNYDSNYELIIDPVTRLWGTYYGGTGDDLCAYTKADVSGNVFLAGHSGSNSGTVIATTGSHQSVFGGNLFDAFLVKFNGAGVRSWGTYYGGSGSDFGLCCTIDNSGNIFLVGYTSSTSGAVMTTAGGLQTTYGGGTYDGYVVQFNSSGTRLWASYYGGAGTDVGNSCSIDPSGNIYMTGYTAGSTGTVIATSGGHQSAYGGGTWDAYLVKFTNSGTRTWATYYGGSANDVSYSCAADANGNIYMSGHSASNSGTVIATAGSHQTSNSGGDDGYLVKFNSSGVRQWATYYGGVATDNVYSCGTDASGNVFISGHTSSNSSAVFASAGAHQSTFGGMWDIFVAKFNSSGVRSWGTYLGDSGTDLSWSSDVDASGAVYLAGYATNVAGTVIATPGSHQTTHGGGNYDAYLVKFRSDGVRLWGTYYGGSGDESTGSSSTDGSGNVYLVGLTTSTVGTVIATPGSHQTAYTGSNDIFLVKFADCNIHTATVGAPLCAGATLSLSVNTVGTSNPTYNWSGPNSFTSAVQNPTISNASSANVGMYTLTLNYGVCVEATTVQVAALNPQPTITVNSGTICTGNKFVIVPSGASSYTVTGGSFTVTPSNTNSYVVIGTNSLGCVSAPVVSKVTVDPCTGLNESGNASLLNSVTIYPNPTSGQVTIESEEDADVRIIDIHGRLVTNFSIHTGVNTSDFDKLQSGVYFMEVVGGKNKQVFRIVKQ